MRKLLALLVLCMVALTISAHGYGRYIQRPSGQYWHHVCRTAQCPCRTMVTEYRSVCVTPQQGGTTINNTNGTVVYAGQGAVINYYGNGTIPEAQQQTLTVRQVEVQPTQNVVSDPVQANVWYIRFRRGSSDISKWNDAEIARILAFADKNPDYEYLIDGYADDDTGYDSYNNKLSARRVDEVVKVLAPELGQKKLKVRSHGSKEQPYYENDMNRCVIITAVRCNKR